MPTPADYLNISEVVDVLEDIGIDYWVSHGTLLGFAREGKILEWDNDIDIAVEGPEAITHWKMLFGALMDKGFQVDYRFNYILCSRFNQVDLPISLELNWETDSRFLYVGGAWGTRNPGLIAYFVERLFFRVIISLLETVPNAYHADERWEEQGHDGYPSQRNKSTGFQPGACGVRRQGCRVHSEFSP
jgi:hypothetical protein